MAYIELKDTSAVWGAITGAVTDQTDLIDWINLNVVAAPFLGTIVPTTTPTGTGSAYWIATQNGTYTNFGGLVVNANSFAVISRNASGVFSISQTALDLTSYAKAEDLNNYKTKFINTISSFGTRINSSIKLSGAFQSTTEQDVLKYNVVSGQKFTIIGKQSTSISIALWGFYAADTYGALIEVGTQVNTNSIYDVYAELTAPVGATILYVTKNKSQAITLYDSNNVKVDIEDLQTDLTNLDSEVLKKADQESLDNLEYKIDKVLEIEENSVIDFDQNKQITLTTAVFLADLKAGIKYTIFSSSSDNLSEGLEFYKELPSLTSLKFYPNTTDFLSGVSFVFTPEIDLKLYIRTRKTGVNVQININHLEFESPFSVLKNFPKSEKVYQLLNFTPTVTTNAYETEFSRYSGQTLDFNLRANYTGQFTFYATINNVLTNVYSVSGIDWSIAGGVDFTVTIPENTTTVFFRYHQNTQEVYNITLTKNIVDDIFLPELNQWKNKTVSFYGDSNVASGAQGGVYDFPVTYTNHFAPIVARVLEFDKTYRHGIGGQKYTWGNGGGSVSFNAITTGVNNSRIDGTTYDEYSGTPPSGTVALRGSFSSWLRIISTYPAAIKDSIDSVIIMGGTNDTASGTGLDALNWIPLDTTDPEWASSSFYATYGGDFNLNSIEGAIASTIMKFQAWMPNTRIILATPPSGRGTSGQLEIGNLITVEYTKSQLVRKVAGLMSIPLVDVYAQTGINGFNRTIALEDGLHYYEKGSKYLALPFVGGLKSISPQIF
jgi:hypothetical protein